MASETRFVGSIPELYDRHLGPVLFEPFAREIASRVPAGTCKILEVAAGTGRTTRHLLGMLPADGELVVTDLNEPMLAEAKRRVGDDARLTWQVADAQALPVESATFDAVVCQFGLMFIPDKARALREMRRALRTGGTLLLTTWDDLDANPASGLLHRLAFDLLPEDPPLFMRVPFSMPDPDVLAALGRESGFRDVEVETVTAVAEAESAAHLATGFVRGNPLWNQLTERGIDTVAFEATVARALAEAFGDTPCLSPLSARLLSART